MAENARARLRAGAERLRAAGKSDEEIVAWVRSQSQGPRTEIGGEQGGQRALGQVQADLLSPQTARFAKRLEAGEFRNPLQAPEGPGLGDRLVGAGKYLAQAAFEAPEAIASNPREAGQVFGESAEGAIQAAPAALANLIRSKDQPSRGDLEAQAQAGFLPRSYMAAQPREASPEQAEIDARTERAKQERTDRQKFANIAGNTAVAPLTPGGVAGAAVLRGIPAANVLARAGRAALAGGAGGAVEGTTNALARGADVEDALEEGVGAGTVGAVLGAGLQGASEVPRAGRAAIQAISPTVGRYAKAKDAGLLPEARELPSGQEGITQASQTARDRVLNRRGELKKEASEAYKETVGPDLKKPARVEGVKDRLSKLRDDNTTNEGVAINDKLADALELAEEKLGKNPDVESINKLARSFKKQASFGNPSPSPEQMAMREVYRAFKAGAKEASPAVKQADEAYSAAMTKDREIMDTLGVSKGVRNKADKRRAAAELEYLNDDSVPALKRAPDLAQLIKMDPQIADALARLDAKKALEATRLLTLTPSKRTSLDPAVTQLPVIGGSVRLLGQYSRGLGRIADQGLANFTRAGEAGVRAAGPAAHALLPFDPYRLKLEMALEERERRKAQR